MSTAMRWFETNTAETLKAPWVIGTGAIYTLLIVLISTGVFCTASESAPLQSLLRVPGRSPSSGASARHAALRVEDVFTKSIDPQLPPHPRGHAADIFTKNLPYRSEPALRRLVRELDVINRLSRPKDTDTRRVSSADVFRPSVFAKGVLEKLGLFPLAAPLRVGETSHAFSPPPAAVRSASPGASATPAELHMGETRKYEHKKRPAHEDTSVVTTKGTAAAADLGGEPTDVNTVRDLTVKNPVDGLSQQPKSSGQHIEDKKKSEGSMKRKTKRTKQGSEHNVPGEHPLTGKTKTKSGDNIKPTDRDEREIIEIDRRIAEGATVQGNREKQAADQADVGKLDRETIGEDTSAPPGSQANTQRVRSREVKVGQNVRTNTRKEQEEKRGRRGPERNEGQSSLSGAATHIRQTETQTKDDIGLTAKSIPIPPTTATLPSYSRLFGRSTVPLGRQRGAQLRNTHRLEDGCSSKRWEACRKSPAARRNMLEGFIVKKRNHHRADGRMKNTSLIPAPQFLPPVSEGSVYASSLDTWTFPKDTVNPWGKEDTLTQQDAWITNLNAGSAALRPSTSTGPPFTAAIRRQDGGRPHTPTHPYSKAGSFNTGPGHRQPSRGEKESRAEVVEFPLSPSTGELSIRSFTSNTSSIFRDSQKVIIPLPVLLLESTESVARYIEPDEKHTEDTRKDTQRHSELRRQMGDVGPTAVTTRTTTAHAARRDATISRRTCRGHGAPGRPRGGRGNTVGRSVRYTRRKFAKRNTQTRHAKLGQTRALPKNQGEGTGSDTDRRQERYAIVTRGKKAGSRRVGGKTRTRFASGAAARRRDSRCGPQGGGFVKSRHDPPRRTSRTQYGDLSAGRTIFSRTGRQGPAVKKYGKQSKKSLSSRGVQLPVPPDEELMVDEDARAQLGKRAARLMKNPLIERSSSECLNMMADFLTPGTTVMFEPRPQVPEQERFIPVSLVWGHPLGAGANGIVYEVTTKTRHGRKVRFALKLSLNRHQQVCNAWTRDKRGELTPEERTTFYDDVQRVCAAEYEMEMKQRRLLSLPRPSPSSFSYSVDAGKLFAENQVCVPAAVGRIRGLPDYFVCPGGSVAVVNVAGLTPAASCNLYQILAAYDLSMAEKYELTRQVISAMSRLHALGLLHKDLKSENLIVTSKGRVIVADLAGAEPITLGVAKPVERFDPGTVTFVAPERAASRLGRPGTSGDITVKANAWSLGMMVYEIWCRGRDPFNLETLTDEEVLIRLDSMLRHRYPLSFTSCPPVPSSIQKLIKALLQPDPRYRKVPSYFMWTLPLLRKAQFLKPPRSRTQHKSHA